MDPVLRDVKTAAECCVTTVRHLQEAQAGKIIPAECMAGTAELPVTEIITVTLDMPVSMAADLPERAVYTIQAVIHVARLQHQPYIQKGLTAHQAPQEPMEMPVRPELFRKQGIQFCPELQERTERTVTAAAAAAAAEAVIPIVTVTVLPAVEAVLEDAKVLQVPAAQAAADLLDFSL